MIDDVCVLIGTGEVTLDKYLNEIPTEVKRTVMCRVSSTVRNEFYQAANAGLKAEWTIRLSDFMEYQGEKKVEYNGEVYDVLRTYRDEGSFHKNGGANEIELILGSKVGESS